MMRPIPIPQLEPASDEEKKEWTIAEEIRNNMLSKRKSAQEH